jgi:hypothetical protein
MEWCDNGANETDDRHNKEKLTRSMGVQGTECCEFISKEKKKKSKKKNHATANELMQVLKTQGFRCALTGIELTPQTARLDHIVAVSKGGTDVIENLQWLHIDANTAKATMAQDQFIAMCRKVAAYQS